jgi:outer membrane receptor protein involved in Fe transport
VIVTFGGGIVGFENRAEAKVYGAEFEARHKLDVVDDLLADFSVGFNFSYIISEVPLTEQEKINDPNSPDPRRFTTSPSGSSTWTSAGTIRGGDDARRWSFNWAAPRIYLVDVGGPDVYEHPPMLVDLIVSQKLGKHWSVRFTGKNLLNAEYQRTYGDQPDQRVYSRNTRGVVFGIQATIRFVFRSPISLEIGGESEEHQLFVTVA